MPAAYRFAAGVRVVFKPGPLHKNVRGGCTSSLRDLPATPESRLDRVKRPEDQFERVIEEQKLHAV